MELIEDFMIAANGVTARYLVARNFPSLRRVVRTPKRWERIVELAQAHDGRRPSTPVEGRVVHGFEGMDVGDRVRVQLIGTNVERGFIDFKHVGSSRL